MLCIACNALCAAVFKELRHYVSGLLRTHLVQRPQELQRAYRSMVERVCASSLEHWGLDSVDELRAASAQARMRQRRLRC